MAYDIGVVGLGVMGANLALNIEDHGFAVAGFDLDEAKAAAFVTLSAGAGEGATARSAADLVAMLKRPRRVLLMVPAGAPVDAAIAAVAPHLEAGDILIDAGNSHFADTERRCRELDALGFHFVGMASPAARKARGAALRSCREDSARPGTRCGRSCARSRRARTMASPASSTSGRAALGTT